LTNRGTPLKVALNRLGERRSKRWRPPKAQYPKTLRQKNRSIGSDASVTLESAAVMAATEGARSRQCRL
jgi:hypothetical protein